MKLKRFDDKGNVGAILLVCILLLVVVLIYLAGSFAYLTGVSACNFEKEIKFLEQGDGVEDFNIKTILLWHGDDYPLRAEDHYTPEELNMIHSLYIREYNLTKEEFPIFDFANGTVPDFE